MRLIVGTVLVAALAYGGYWAIGARALEAQVAGWLDEGAQSQTRGLALDGFEIGGFPHRFDLTLEAPRFDIPGTMLRWRAPELKVHALSYKPNHLIAVFPPDQVLRAMGQDWALHSEDMRASVITHARPSLPVSRANLIAEPVRLRGPAGMSQWQAHALRLALHGVEGTQSGYDLALDAQGLRPDSTWLSIIDPTSALPAQIDRLGIDAMIDLDAPLDRAALDTPPRLRAVTLRRALLDWGEIGLGAAGEVTVDAAGLMDGEVTLDIADWRATLEVLRDSGVVAQDMMGMVEFLFASLARPDEPGLEVPFQVRQSRVNFGPLTLAILPPL